MVFSMDTTGYTASHSHCIWGHSVLADPEEDQSLEADSAFDHKSTQDQRKNKQNLRTRFPKSLIAYFCNKNVSTKNVTVRPKMYWFAHC